MGQWAGDEHAALSPVEIKGDVVSAIGLGLTLRRGWIQREVGDLPRVGKHIDNEYASPAALDSPADLRRRRRDTYGGTKLGAGEPRGREHGHVLRVVRRKVGERMIAEPVSEADGRGHHDDIEQ